LCLECNNLRLEDNKIKNSDSIDEVNERLLKQRKTLLNTTKLKQVSSKQNVRNTLLSKVYRQIASEREMVCTGCGTSQNLSNSHIIPRSRQPNMTTEPTNITYHCLDKCHPIWETHDIRQMKQLFDFEDNMQYIKVWDIDYYNVLMNKYDGTE
jgi:coenzyme F420-reducing hydrogenase gamma subunit